MTSPLIPLTGQSDSAIVTLGQLLIVDDEQKLLATLCEMLTAHGYEAVGYTSGQEALQALQERSFDLLLSDLMMPKMDGVTLLRAALDIDPHLVGIIMTGQGTVQTAVEAMKTGAFDYVLKPFKLSAVLPVLERALAVRRIRMENVQLRESVEIYELSQAIAYTLDLNIILNKVADAALRQCEADEVSIMLPTREKNDLYIAVVRGEQHGHLLGERLPIGQGVAGWVARSREPLVLHGEIKDPRFAPINPRTDISSALSLPMLVGNQLVGVLNLNILRCHRRSFTLGQIKAVQILTTTAAMALKSASLYTESKRLQEFNANIVASIAEGLVLLDPEGQLLLANAQAQNLLGYLTEELIGQYWAKLVPLSEQPFIATQIARRTEGAPTIFETRLLTKANQEISVLASASPFIQDGQVAGTLVMFRDITERKQAEETLHESQTRLSGIIDSAMDAIITVNEAQTILLFNPAAAHMFGYPGEDMVGQPLARLLPERVRVAHREHIQHFGQTGVTMREMGALGALHGLRADGEEFPVEASISQIVVAGEKLYTVILRDISEQQRAVQAIQALNELLEQRVQVRTAELMVLNKELEAFSYSVSHDLRAPLRNVAGFIELFTKSVGQQLSKDPQRYLTIISDETKRMGVLIDDLLAFSRIGRVELQKRAVDLTLLIQEVQTSLQLETQGREIAWQIGELPQVYADRALLRQVLINLMANALKFTRPRAQAKIEIGILPTPADEPLVVVFIRDNGVGFDMKYNDKLFNVFQRLHRAEEFEGTGVGLAIVQRIIHRHGGRVWAEAAVEQGATFFVALPQKG